jgi:ParB-like chromosome segregation protein Spo0J
MFLELLAQTPPIAADNSGSIITGFVVAVIGAVFAGLTHMQGKKAGRAETLKVEPQPLSVRMEEHFVTRREFDLLRTEMVTGFNKAEALITRMSERVDTKHKELLDTIERAAKTGTDGRVHLWEDLKKYKKEVADEFKEQGERVAKVEAGVQLAERVERIATEALTRKQSRV